MDLEHIDLNEEFSRAYELMETTQKNIFITGKAGTGKSTLLRYFRKKTSKNVVALAPTGVAALNIKGQTIHSFFRFRPDVTVESVKEIKIRKTQKKMYEHIDTIVIDEISMVRADLLDCIDMFLQKYGKYKDLPFGGVQIILIGDLYQLPPVVTSHERDIFNQGHYASPYFFSAKSFKYLRVKTIELTKIYRQKEKFFINLLNAIRDNTADDTHIRILNQRCKPDFKPKDQDYYVYLTTTNDLADKINSAKLKELFSKSYFYEGQVTGEFEDKNLPTSAAVEVKSGAQIMLLNNDPQGRWINGTIGKVIDFVEDELTIRVQLADNEEIVSVTPFTWEVYKFYYNEDIDALDSQLVGSFTQFPLRLAWAVTIHKSQGKTFPKVIVDIGYGTFSHGQTYVALSRCTSLAGLVLKRPIFKKHIMLDERIVKFMNQFKEDTDTLLSAQAEVS